MGKISKNTKAVVINGDNSGVVNLLNININILVPNKEEMAKGKVLGVIKDILTGKAVTQENYCCFWRHLSIMLADSEKDSVAYFIRFFRILIVMDYRVGYFMFKSAYLSYIEQKEIVDAAFDDIFNIIPKDNFKIPKEFFELVKDVAIKFEAAKSVCEDLAKYAAKREKIDKTMGISFNDSFYREKMEYNKKMAECFEILFTENYEGDFPN